ncbi:MAG: LuxR C-terminal-related transcriptional regulator [Sporocytophaga sp.]|nr:LuxR C-terminal-related transcriptional regulator [Sporocytophaga sp.]
MTTLEIILLVITYTSLILTIFLEIICYKRNIETLQTIGFTISLLFLIISLTATALVEQIPATGGPTNVFILFAMTTISLTTPLNILEERQHNLKPVWAKLHIGISLILCIMIGAGQYLKALNVIQYIVASYLGITVIASMLLINNTKPQKRIAHREKLEKSFSILFIIIVPLSLLGSYAFENFLEVDLKFGFTLPIVFILLAGSKLMDDLQRLSLLKPKSEHKKQHFENFALTKRERELSLLLLQGKSYQEISDELNISMPTVKTHASNIYKKCGVNSRHELTALITN